MRLLLALAAGCAPAEDSGIPAAPGAADRALIVVLDGARLEESLGMPWTWGGGTSDAWGGPTADLLPEVRARLLPEGTLALPAFQVGPTMTVPAHANLLTGARRPYLNLAVPEGPGLYRPDLPTAFELLRAEEGLDAGAAVLVGNTSLLEQLAWSIAPGFGAPFAATWEEVADPDDLKVAAESDAAVLRAAQAHLAAGARLVVANLHHIDRVGHEDPWRYPQAVAAVDGPLVALWDWIQSDDSGLADRTLLLVTTDHGRHRFWPSPTPWQDHGCACAGCRALPLLLLGPGIARGRLTAVPHVWEDAMATVAYLLGFDLPYATGRPMDDALLGDPGVLAPTGPRQLYAAGHRLAWEQATGRPEERVEVVADGVVYADPEALLAEAPRVAGDFACWRRLDVRDPGPYWGWSARCVDLGTGTALGFPEAVVAPDFSPALAADASGRLWAAFPDLYPEEENGRSIAEDGEVRLERWDPRVGWERPAWTSAHAYGPSAPALLLDRAGAWLAWAAGDSIETGRMTRHLALQRVDWPARGAPTAAPATQVRGVDLGLAAPARLESPTLGRVGGVPTLAFQVIAEDGVHLGLAALGAEGWGPAELIRDGGILPHIPPAFCADGALWWARQGAAGAEVCRLEAGAAACQDAGAPWIDSLAPGDGGAWVSGSQGGGAWEVGWVGG